MKRRVMNKWLLVPCLALLGLSAGRQVQAEFLYDPPGTMFNGLYWPTLNYNEVYRYSAWDVFSAPHTAPNYPDIYADFGGDRSDSPYVYPVQRSESGIGDPDLDVYYNPEDPYAYWDVRNPTITQSATSAFIIGVETQGAGNIYTYSEKTSYVLRDQPILESDPSHPIGNTLQTVVFQFQTDGSNVDFSSIELVYKDSHGNEFSLSAPEGEYLREYRGSSGGHWSSQGGYSNRIAIQWDLSDIEYFQNPANTAYEIRWASSSSSMSFQKVDLVTSAWYQAGIPLSATWTKGNGLWSGGGNWDLHKNGFGEANEGLQGPQDNGNVRFRNTQAAEVTLDEDGIVGELIFENSPDVTLNSINGRKLTTNTGITTGSSATGTYTLNTDLVLGALNFFEINGGTVVLNGVLSGDYGVVKGGAGTLELNGDNVFSGYLGIQGGTVRVTGTNTYTGATSLVRGDLIIEGDALVSGGTLGTPTVNFEVDNSILRIGADESLYTYVTGGEVWQANLMVDGNYRIDREVQLAPGDNGKRLGAIHASGEGAEFSGTIRFTGNAADTDNPNPDHAAGNVSLTATAADDKLIFSGAMIGGATGKTLTLDGEGTVIFRGVSKQYHHGTALNSGTLLIEENSGYTGNGDLIVNAGAILRVNGVLEGSGSLTLNGGQLAGSGTISREYAIGAGSILAPGNSVGHLETGAATWLSGGVYEWEIADAGGTAGSGWDLLTLSGDLDLSSLTPGGFEIRITSLDALGNAGPASGFDSSAPGNWLIASVEGGDVLGFDATLFTITTDDFLNPFGGAFAITASEDALFLTYSAIPEPGTWALLVTGAVLLAGRWHGRRKAGIS